MLELFSSGLMSVWLEMAGVQRSKLDVLQGLLWLDTPGFVLPVATEPATAITVQQYLKDLSKKGSSEGQGVWIQSGPILLASKQGTVPLPAASLTKIATSLVALSTWQPSHRFETLIGATGPVKNGVLYGDLIVTGGGDPLFVWEEAIAIGNSLNRMGIKRVSGNLIISGNFAMNYQTNPALAGQMFHQALNASTWNRRVTFHYALMPKGTPKPQVAIAGGVKVSSLPIPKQILWLRHHSLTLAQILKQMNVHSNNTMAQMLADLVGGANVVQTKAAAIAGFPRQEIHLINGSGLGVENRISPRAVCAMLAAIQRQLQPFGLNLGDLFPVFGFDHTGTVIGRRMPPATVFKTGTLNDVSALAGVMPTRDRGLIWFSIINRGNDVLGFRAGQDQFLQTLLKHWGIAPKSAIAITPNASSINTANLLGDKGRNEILSGG